ncbi:MAG TPA: AMP-binding protein, partial [Kofleriaceae bacterium]
MNELSIFEAAREAPARVAIETASQSLTFEACAAAAARVQSGSGAAAIVATPSIETVLAVHAALAAQRPIALLHHRLVPDEMRRQRELVERAELPADAAVILFTSGSTGSARGVVLSRAALVAAAGASALHLGWRDDDRWLLALSLAHAGGLSIVIRCLAGRRPIALCDHDFDRAPVAQMLERCTLASLVPAQLASLLDDPAWRPPARLRAVLLGGA